MKKRLIKIFLSLFLSINFLIISVFPVFAQSASHGVGLCMTGVKVLAESGSDYQSILKYYYTGVEIKKWDAILNVRVGVSSDPLNLTIRTTGPFQVKDSNNNLIADGAAGDAYQVAYSGGFEGIYSVTKIGEPSPRYAGQSFVRFIPTDASTFLKVDGWINWNGYARQMRGSIEVRFIFDSKKLADNNLLWAINELDLEEYVAGILEEPDIWPKEGLRTLAVAARTYVLNKILYGGKHRNSAGVNIFDVDATANDQQYIGYWNGANHRAATEATAKEVVTYDGKVIVAAYSGYCGGVATKNSEDVGWGYYPYLRSVPMPGNSAQNASLPGEISGKVVSKTTRKPISGVTVKLEDLNTTTTDSNGVFKFTSVQPGKYILYYISDVYDNQTQEGIVVVSRKTTTPPTAIMSPPNGEIKGRVINSTGQTIPGTVIRINSSLMPTNPGGEFRFTKIHNGVYTIYYDAPGYLGQTQESIRVNGSAVTTPTVILSAPNGEIKGRVVNSSGQTIPGTAIRINSSLMPTNPGGEFRFTKIHNGVYTIYYDAPGYLGQTQENIRVNGSAVTTPTVILSKKN
ncbi:MAG: carboxypeptidase regulatory-like domain-containing protein [Actinobacteria bacterium]|nr:carboxypeptidase regulatory-like domain-containing protein [Actinomycetota bacterium]